MSLIKKSDGCPDFSRPEMYCTMFTRHDRFCRACRQAIEDVIALYAQCCRSSGSWALIRRAEPSNRRGLETAINGIGTRL